MIIPEKRVRLILSKKELLELPEIQIFRNSIWPTDTKLGLIVILLINFVMYRSSNNISWNKTKANRKGFST